VFAVPRDSAPTMLQNAFSLPKQKSVIIQMKLTWSFMSAWAERGSNYKALLSEKVGIIYPIIPSISSFRAGLLTRPPLDE